ncbi:DNA-protecting protein DprA [Cellulomonas sp. JH27-2]|uniref:DNA-processing protein DprA n=1 Tax=Cellulomonas sp. JH27-2 TaxID=2774139 RepID=UPI00177F6F24|nr:DNA-processing protein DprA [Cellulomonas sp. JH27-2]MBD8060526.1 DNA-protecting protein DprA [Cellulomonas sp. JH27-2]
MSAYLPSAAEVPCAVDAEERTARAAWSALAEPGDPVAGALVASLGAVDAWRLVTLAVDQGLPAAWARVVRGGDGVLVDGRAAGADAVGGQRLSRAVARWAARRATLDVARDLAAIEQVGGVFVVPGDPGWPSMLDDLGHTAPFGLWVRGESGLAASLDRSVAIVGSRASTAYGERVAVDLAAGAVDSGCAVVSGGAYGIDAAAHRGAVARGGPTLVLLAGGVDRAYPAGNARLFEAVVEGGGALASEVPVGAVPTRSRFLQRNRLIAAGARATVVVEAAWRSGAMSTAHHAVGLLRPVGAVPGPVTSVASAGCHRLLREGAAVCVTDAAEVLELVGRSGADVVPEGDGARRATDHLDPLAARVRDALGRRRGTDVAGVASAAAVTLEEARGALGLLELDGLARLGPGGWVMVDGHV